MFTHFPHKITFLFYFIISVSWAQKAPEFKYKMDCYERLIQANTVIRTTGDTVEYSRIFNEIDSLTMLENNHDFYVKYCVLRGALLARNGFHEEGLKYNLKAIEYGKEHLPPTSPRIAVAHGNLGYTYHAMGEIDSFINHTLISNQILLNDPVKNAADLIQTNLNLFAYLDDKPEIAYKINEQNDSLIHFLSEKHYDIKAFYHLKKSKQALHFNNFRESKLHINQAIQSFNSAVNPKVNLQKHFYSAIATHYFMTNEYNKSIDNYRVYKNLATMDNNVGVLSYVSFQMAMCYKDLNNLDSARYYIYQAYDEIKEYVDNKRKQSVAIQAVEVLKFNNSVDGKYDIEVYKELENLAKELLTIPIYYLEYAKIRSEINSEDKGFYESVLLDYIKTADNKVFQSYCTSKLAEYYIEENKWAEADSLVDVALYLNQVMPEQTNSVVYNSNLIRKLADYKYEILSQNINKYTDLEILDRYNIIIENLLIYVYENWDSADRDEVLKEIDYYSNEAIEFCYEQSRSADKEEQTPYFEYALYFSDQSNSILFKYNQRRIFAFENSKFSKEKIARLNYYKGKLDAYFYGEVDELEQKDLLDIQSQYNALLVEAQTSKSVFVEAETFEEFVTHSNNTKRQYDDVFVFHSSKNDIYKLDLKAQNIIKLALSKMDILKCQNDIFDAMINHKSAQYEQSAYLLFQSFFGTGLKEETKNVLIINAPDLLPIPLEGLVKSIKNESFNNLDYLLSDYIFTYNQGLSSDYNFKKNFDLSVPYVGVYSENGTNLQYAKSEIESVKELLKGEVYPADNYKQEEILERLKLAQVVHIATHSETDSTNAYSSQLVFGNDTSNVNLKYYEIMNLDINPNLLVLNACSTGDGVYKIGEGKISMARAFNYAGAHNVLVNAWDVSDFSVKKVMESFFEFYTDKNEVAKSLQLAKKAYLKDSDDLTGNPLYWAGTIFVSANHVKSNEYLWSVMLGIFAFSSVLILLAFKSKS